MDEDQIQEQQEEIKDRNAEQFDKLTQHNKELKEERDKAQEEAEKAKAEAEQYKKLYQAPTNQTPDAKQFSNLSQQQVDQAFSTMVDDNGFLDGNKLMQTLQGMNQRAIQAEERAKRAEQTAQTSQKSLTERSEKEAQAKVYSKYPMLDPDNKETFDPKMWRYVYNELAVKAKAGENPSESDYIEAADKVYQDFYADRDMGKKSEEQRQQKVEQKQQINAVRPVSNLQAGYYANDDDAELMKKVQAGKRGSIAELLKRRNQ